MEDNRQVLLQKLKHKISLSTTSEQIHFQVEIIDLIIYSKPQLKLFRQNPSIYLKTLHSYFTNQLKKSFSSSFQDLLKVSKTKIFLKSIPYSDRLYLKLKNLSEADIDNWVVVTGTVVQALQNKTLEKSKIFSCNECGAQYRKQNSYQNYYRFQMSSGCTNKVQKQKTNSLYQFFHKNINKRKKSSKAQEQKQPTLSKCNSIKYTPLDNHKICQDYQQIRIQEQFKHISAGKLPQTLTVIIEGNLGQNCRAGDDVLISGVLNYRFKKPSNDQKMNVQMVLVANTIHLQKSSLMKDNFQERSVAQESQMSFSSFKNPFQSQSFQQDLSQQLQLRNQIIKKFCPTIYGRDIVKLGLILCILGGVSFQNEQTKIRGQSHALLIGEPGTGKSVLIKQAANLAQRSFFTNGIGTSSAGLSVSYYKDGADWTIEPGALVLADNGVCCIDELTLLAKKDQNSLLQAMQQQTISSAKASVVGKLNARTTVIGACNPVTPNQRYDPSLDLQTNTGLSVPLLTRFDLILILKDQSERQQDALKCQYVLQKFTNQQQTQVHQLDQNFSLKALLKKCRLYQPQLRGGQLLSKYYIEQRKNSQKVTTARTFQSLCRLSEAHAKLMMRDYTTDFDCLTAIMLTENRLISSIQQYAEFVEQFQQKYQVEIQ